MLKLKDLWIIDTYENESNNKDIFLVHENKNIINDHDDSNNVTLPYKNDSDGDDDYYVDVGIRDHIDDDIDDYELYDITFETLSFERKLVKINLEYMIVDYKLFMMILFNNDINDFITNTFLEENKYKEDVEKVQMLLDKTMVQGNWSHQEYKTNIRCVQNLLIYENFLNSHISK